MTGVHTVRADALLSAEIFYSLADAI